MSQHDMDLTNAAGASFRADANLAFAALVSNSSGATAPATMFAYQFWADTTTGFLKQRNAANSAWITLFRLSDMAVQDSSFALIDDGDNTKKAVFQLSGISTGQTRVITLPDADITLGSNSIPGLFRKSDPTTAAFVKTGAATISTQAAILYIEVNGVVKTIAASTAFTMPSHSSGVDYAIWAKTDGTLEATSNHVTPPSANARKVGGYHYAPGGNATGVAGGDTTPAINAYSIWDLKFRPACPDPRGMTLVADGFWSDIYLLGVDHPTNGSSKYNVTIADGSSPPKIPAKFGGNGSTAYAGGNWWDLAEVLHSFGKRPPSYDEFAALAYGVLEAYSIESDPVTTGLVNGTGGGGAGIDHNAYKYTSKWGVIQATGNLLVWGSNFGGPYNVTAAWQADTGGRGSDYNLANAVVLGGGWNVGVYSGSRSSYWASAPTYSHSTFGARGVCDHLILD